MSRTCKPNKNQLTVHIYFCKIYGTGLVNESCLPAGRVLKKKCGCTRVCHHTYRVGKIFHALVDAGCNLFLRCKKICLSHHILVLYITKPIYQVQKLMKN